uniref:Uncharacterized protein n=1 Tax=Glossina pallidipes TaxID=7398 RepID=A0A1B0A1X3_GLOPL
MLNPTADMEVAANNVLCQVPLQCIEKCKYKKYPTLPRKVYEVEDEKKYLDQADPYWSRFLRSQADSSAKYLYRMSFFGSNRDPTMVKKEPFPPALIHQRLLHMPVIGALDRDAMFYMLCFVLNMLRLNPDSQKDVLKKFRERNMIDNEILIYMQLISRHPNTGLTNEQRDHVIRITQDIINEHSTIRSNNYFNPDHIFKKSFVEIDPYELEYLKSIMHTTEDLTKQQFLYLTMLVERLQEMPLAKRDQYVKLLHSKGVLPSEKFTTLTWYLSDKAKPFDSTRLKTLFQELETLMDIAETMPPTRPAEIPKKYISTTEIKTDAYKVTQTLEALMKGAVENIVRLSELKNFLKNLMSLTPYEMESTLNSLKNSYVLDKDQFQFLIDFVEAGRLRGDPKKLQLLTDMLEKVSGTPIGTQVPNNDNAAMGGQGQGGAKKKLTVIKAAAPIIAAVASKERMLAMWSIQSLNQQSKYEEKAAAVKKPKKLHEGTGVTLGGKDASRVSGKLGSTTAKTGSSLLEKRAAETDPTFTGKGEAAVAGKNLEQAEIDPTSSTAKAKALAATRIFEKTWAETDATHTQKDEAAAADENLEQTSAARSPTSTGKDAATPGKGHSRKEEEMGSAVAKPGRRKENISLDEDSTDISADKEDVGGDGDVKRGNDAKARHGTKHQGFKKIGAGDQKKKGDKGQVKKGIPVSHGLTAPRVIKSAISAASILSAMKLDTTKNVKKEREKGQRMDYFEYPPPLYRSTQKEYMLEGPNGPIPLIRNRALFFHFCTRSGKTNRIVSIKNGILRFR